MLKQSLIFIILFVSFNCKAQSYWELDSTIHFENYYTNNPQKIVEKLISKEDNEIEKFKKIFSWVVVNIKYDVKQIKNNTPYEKKSISKILQRKKGLCGDYATLLDTLCHFAGITSVKVNGHARNLLSNVKDTIFTENHAWNAVKLNNQWFLVDATWASSYAEYDYTKCSKVRLKILEYLYSNYKIKEVYSTNTKKSCVTELNELQKFQIRHYHFFNRIGQKILLLFPFKIFENNVHQVNSNYFLAAPEYFSLTHFPSDPKWSLLENEINHDSFRNDSSYFFPTKKIYTKGGRICYSCDSYVKLNRNSQLKISTKNTLKNDSLFRFSAWENEFEKGNLDFQKSLTFDDSLNKIIHLDSAIFSFKYARNHLFAFKKIIDREYVFHKNKNNLKLQLFLDEYNTQKKNINDFKKLFFTSKRTYLSAVKKYSKLINTITLTNTQLIKLQSIKTIKRKNKNQKIIDLLKTEIEAKNQTIDSINNIIYNKRYLATQLNNDLLFSISDKAKLCDSTLNSIHYLCFIRSFLYDNLNNNTIIAQAIKQKKITKLVNDCDSLVFKKCKQFSDNQKDIFNLTKQKNDLHKKILKQFIQLVQLEEYSIDSLKNYTQNIVAENDQMNDWIQCLTLNASRVSKGLKYFSKKVYNLKDTFEKEKVIEKKRFQEINKRIKKDKNRNSALYKTNLKTTAIQINSTIKLKELFLKELKILRKNKK